MIVHFHTAIVPNSGELKRMKNIDRDFSSSLGEKSVEVVFFESKFKKYVKENGHFYLSDNVEHKFYIPLYPKLGRITRIVFFAFLAIFYHPSYVIGERGMYINNLWPFKLFSPKTKLVVDIHGAVAEELEYQKKSQAEINKGRAEEKIAVTSVDYVICQSDEMKRYIINNYQVNPSQICVYRCGIDNELFKLDSESRIAIRAQLGIDDKDIVFIYSGGLHPWQRVGDSIEMFNIIHKEYPSTKLIILTGDIEGAYNMLQEQNVSNIDKSIIITKLPFKDVPKYLNAADVAFLLRHNHIMNAVASPTKLAEYMGCGLPVISTAVSQYWLNGEGVNYIINYDEKLSLPVIMDKIRNSNRRTISHYSHSTLSLTVDKLMLKKFLSKQ